MKKIQVRMFVFTLLATSLIMTGCSKAGGRAPDALPPSKVPETMNKTFGGSTDETKDMATTYVSAFQSQDTSAAFAELQRLSRKHDLTLQQRTVVARAMITTIQQLRAAAQSGNQAADSALHQYLSSR